MKQKQISRYFKTFYLFIFVSLCLGLFTGCNDPAATTVHNETDVTDEIEHDIDQGTLEDSIKVDDYISISNLTFQSSNHSLFFQFSNTGDYPVEITSFSLFEFSDTSSSYEELTGDVISAPTFLSPGNNGYAYVSNLKNLKNPATIEILANYRNDASSSQDISVSGSKTDTIVFSLENHGNITETIDIVAGLLDREDNLIGIAFKKQFSIDPDTTATTQADETIYKDGYSFEDVVTIVPNFSEIN